MTPREGGKYRRASDAPWYWQLVHFVGAPIVDHWQGLSLTRILAIIVLCIVWVQAVPMKVPLSWVHFWAILAAVSAAFGKTMWGTFLERRKKPEAGSETAT